MIGLLCNKLSFESQTFRVLADFRNQARLTHLDCFDSIGFIRMNFEVSLDSLESKLKILETLLRFSSQLEVKCTESKPQQQPKSEIDRLTEL